MKTICNASQKTPLTLGIPPSEGSDTPIYKIEDLKGTGTNVTGRLLLVPSMTHTQLRKNQTQFAH